MAESAELAGVADLLNRPYGKLSGGQQRRVQFALALCGRPSLLFLDEPTVGTVSYTHLDVYKRQPQPLAGGRRRRGIAVDLQRIKQVGIAGHRSMLE